MKFTKRNIAYSVGLVVVTALVTTTLNLAIGNKVLITKDLYEEYKKYNKLLGLEQIIKEDFYKDTEDESLVNGSIKGLFYGLDDPYSQFYTKEEFDTLKEQTSGAYVGIGVVISPVEDDEYITIVSPIEGSPAEEKGLKPGDKIIKVEDTAVYSSDVDKAISMIKGKEGTKVNLTILRENEEFEVEIERKEIVSKTVESEMLDDNIGYIKIMSFNETTYDEFNKALNNLKSSGMKALTLDVRDNPGGLLDVCKEISDDLIGEGTIVYTKDNKGNTEYLKSDKDELGMPMAVLINEGSASASEILTGAIVDNEEGVAIGQTTFGKGLVQSVRELKDGTGYKLTTAQYFTPNGDYIHEKGIKPEIEVEGEEEQLDAAIDYLNGELNK